MSYLRKVSGALVLALLVTYGVSAGLTGSAVPSVAPAEAQTAGNVPGDSLGNASDSEFWRKVRRDIGGSVSIPDKKAATLVQAEGDTWRAFKNGPLSEWGGILLAVTLAGLAGFFLLKGRIRIGHGPHPGGATIERFNAFERMVHWLTASSFVVLGISGLNVLYGRYVIQPVIGPEAFATITAWGKIAHNFLAFPFMIGVTIMFVMWVRFNIPSKHDVEWLLKGGGILFKGVHPRAPRFNAGQKIIFWSVVISGVSLGISGWALLFPFEYTPWATTAGWLNAIGFSLPADFTPIQEMQLSTLWHSIVGLVIIAIIIAHIYIGSLGMEGAFDAVGSGQVDLNWAKEHHAIWVEELEAKEKQQPAE